MPCRPNPFYYYCVHKLPVPPIFFFVITKLAMKLTSNCYNYESRIFAEYNTLKRAPRTGKSYWLNFLHRNLCKIFKGPNFFQLPAMKLRCFSFRLNNILAKYIVNTWWRLYDVTGYDRILKKVWPFTNFA